ncbi:hypothetical protein FE257_008647 [Aspergillus nanangensis]|uniref:Integral membrane protein n=1 Tax=Aspergillus nanangensis TaxID=2582783 RepID=A0AAD4CL55_ASPNN|nr:hypothetical protein FE257_008647 [Aspergillus nanangensis]
MFFLLYFLLAFTLQQIQHAAALPQRSLPSEVTSATSAMVTGTSIVEKGRNCDFDSMSEFFDYANKNRLNITIEVQNCQNLCLLTYGVGNPDLSGIGMMYAYSIQSGLTILVGPVYRLLYRTFAPASSFIRDLRDIQTNFFSSNGFFVGSSALATLTHLSQNPSTFEIAEMQAMAFLQVNSILLTFFCLVVAQPMSRWAARVLLYFSVFVLVIVALGRSHLNSDSRTNWRLASDGCAHSSTDYSVINPVPYPSWAVAIFALAGTFAFWLQSLQERFQVDKLHRSLFKVLMLFWVLLLGLLTAGMMVGLTMMWRQRRHLRSLATDQFEDDQWGFGQIAALAIWAPILVELLYILNGEFAILIVGADDQSDRVCLVSDLAQRKSARWNRWNQKLSAFFSPKALRKDQTISRSNSPAGNEGSRMQVEVKS